MHNNKTAFTSPDESFFFAQTEFKFLDRCIKKKETKTHGINKAINSRIEKPDTRIRFDAIKYH